jgi:hypothetical protein
MVIHLAYFSELHLLLRLFANGSSVRHIIRRGAKSSLTARAGSMTMSLGTSCANRARNRYALGSTSASEGSTTTQRTPSQHHRADMESITHLLITAKAHLLPHKRSQPGRWAERRVALCGNPWMTCEDEDSREIMGGGGREEVLRVRRAVDWLQ